MRRLDQPGYLAYNHCVCSMTSLRVIVYRSKGKCKMIAKTRLETDIPVADLYRLAIREGNSKKPVYWMHKWWARRLGCVVRMLLLAAISPEECTDEELWQRFYAANHLSPIRLLDCFMGGGTSIIEATKLGMHTAGIDIDPIAWFVTRQGVSACDIAAVEVEREKLRSGAIAKRIQRFYQTTIVAASPDGAETTVECDVIYNFWVTVLECPHCHAVFEAHPHYRLRIPISRKSQDVFCRSCHHPHTLEDQRARSFECIQCGDTTDIDHGTVIRGRYTCPVCSHTGRVVDLARTGKPPRQRWFAIEYLDHRTSQRPFKVPDASDFARYEEAQVLLAEQRPALPIPTKAIPLDNRTDLRPTTYGYSYYHQLFNDRQLLALAWLLDWIGKIEDRVVREYFILAFSDALAANNMLCSLAYGYDKLTPLFGLHAYNMITRPIENNVLGTSLGRGSFLSCLDKVIAGKRYCERPYESRYEPKEELEKVFTGEKVSAQVTSSPEEWYQDKGEAKSQPRSLVLNQSSEKMAGIKDGSIDLILSDPPYYNNLSYSELSDFYYAWIRPYLQEIGATWTAANTPYDKALYAAERPGHRDTITSFAAGLGSVFGECARVLNDRGLFVFTFHHLDVAAWLPLAQALMTSRFAVTNVFPIRSEGNSGFHSTEGTVKWDAVLVCRKTATISPEMLLKLPAAGTVGIALNSVASAQVWEETFARASIPFEWPDLVSLALANAVRDLTLVYGPATNVDTLAEALSETLRLTAARIPVEGKQRLNKRKAKGVLVEPAVTE